ncbi:hypothetical protein CQZ99_19420 [Pseudomonas poae]|uniref:Uncharacterized protein n=1 Tax=Pseudomonas poae TaxID=200451 RepID=A0A2S9EHI7_9PSED|nr:hypothetical protein CQZ97_22375 [Pseudomonas poae]PRC14657.1 hypothetical protein CQZ99_19420 [Pseudomonas poae]
MPTVPAVHTLLELTEQSWQLGVALQRITIGAFFDDRRLVSKHFARFALTQTEADSTSLLPVGSRGGSLPGLALGF